MSNRSKCKLYIILVILNVLCIICFSLAAVFNNLSHNYSAMWMDIICVVCWTITTTLNSCTLARCIKKEKEEKEEVKEW